jgi:hypothetical protein
MMPSLHGNLVPAALRDQTAYRMGQNYHMADLESTQRQVAALNDEEAILVLRLVVEHARLPIPGDEWNSVEDHLSEVIAASHFEQYAPQPGASYSTGDLARAVLSYYAESSSAAADAIDQAITYSIRSGERFDPVTLTVAGLVIAVLQTDIKLKHDPKGHWSFELHKKAMRDSTLGRVITTFMGHFLGPGK